jgi:signal peptidase II
MTQKDLQPETGRTPDESSVRLPLSKAALLFWPVAIGGAALDLWSKHAVFEWLMRIPEQQYVLIDGFLRFILRENEGAAFSIFHGWRSFLVLISIVALLAEVVVFFSGVIRQKLVMFAMGCTAGGIVGNLYDRLFNEGAVRDFIDVYVGSYHWPTFNVADSMLCIGVGLMLIANFRAPDSTGK